MVVVYATRNRPEISEPRETGANLILSFSRMTTSAGSYEIHAEARGSHWIGWITREGNTKPDRSVVLVAASRDEAVARARRWVEESVPEH
jgi:hypothetical protein